MKKFQSVFQKHFVFAFLLGFFFLLLTYFTFADQFAIREPNAVSHSPETAAPAADVKENPQLTEKDLRDGADDLDAIPVDGNAAPVCDTDHRNSDVCDVDGDVRTHGASGEVLVVVPRNPNSLAREWKIRPYSRRHITSVKEVTVKQLRSPEEAPACSNRTSVPAVLFSLGGQIGNFWHDFCDVLIPLYIASRRFDGEVQFLVANTQPWYLGKYHPIFRKLSRYDIVDFDGDLTVRCFPRAVVGLRILKEFSIDPAMMPAVHRESMVDFTKFLRSVYSLGRDSPIKLPVASAAKPRLMIISRGHPRKFVNLPEIIQLGETLGFEVVIGDPPFNVDVAEFAQLVNSCDALMGVHGAGLTNSLFLPTGAVFVQVVPYGNLEFLAKQDFGDPAIDMKLRYIEYTASAEESTLMDTLGKDHIAIKDPAAVHRSGWGKVAEYYLGKQDIKLDIGRFAPVLAKAKDLLHLSSQ